MFAFDIECLLKRFRSCQNNPEKSYTEKKAKHEPSGWAMFTKCSFDNKKKVDYYRGIDCIEKACKKIKDRAMEIINYEEQEMIQEITFMKSKKNATYAKKSFVMA